LKHFRRKITKVAKRDVVLDEGDRRAGTHLVECMEMLAAHGMPYVKPKFKTIPIDNIGKILAMNKRFRNLHRASSTATMEGIVLGPRGV
jgi:hypothetical protein